MYRNNLSQLKHNVNWVKKELNIEHCFHALNNAIIVQIKIMQEKHHTN